MKQRMAPLISVFVALILTAIPATGLAEGFCIKNDNGKLSTKKTSANSCAKKQAFIPKVAGPQGPTGPAGSNGLNGSARAYGFVSSTGTLDTALSSSNVSVRKVATGVYCISSTNISVSTVMPVVSADQDQGTGSFRIAMIKSLYGSTFGCTSSEWAIYTAHLTLNSFVTSDGAFSFVVP